jgi:hypothetical protein
MLNNIRWNITSTAERYANADAYVVSVPKSGRTWLRFFLRSYYSAKNNYAFDIKTPSAGSSNDPRIVFSHDLFAHVTEPNPWAKLRGKSLIPRGTRFTKPVILLVRDPRDVIVSLYFQLTKREKLNRRYSGSISQMLRDPVLGIDTVIWVMNTWLNEWTGYEHFKLVRYEDLHSSPELQFRAILNFIDENKLDEVHFNTAINSASFENMRKMESNNEVTGGRLRAADLQDPESYKVRKGVIGGFVSYLHHDDIAYCEKSLPVLDSRFGY